MVKSLNVFETYKLTVTEELAGDFLGEGGDLGLGGGDLGLERFWKGT